MRIVFIGAGSIATNLTRIFYRGGHSIIQIYNRSASGASSLAREYAARYTDSIEEIDMNSDLYVICIKDDVIESIVQNMPKVNGMIVHTSGSTSIQIFGIRFKNYGVLYPFQSFSKFKKADISETPIFIEANKPENEKFLENFASQFSNKIISLTSEKRLMLHLCGVFASNFSNHMYTLAYELAKKNNLPFEIFFPLIKETAEKITHRSPITAQAGPAVRKDTIILEKHKNMLANKPDLLKIYNLLSESIIKFSH